MENITARRLKELVKTSATANLKDMLTCGNETIAIEALAIAAYRRACNLRPKKEAFKATLKIINAHPMRIQWT